MSGYKPTDIQGMCPCVGMQCKIFQWGSFKHGFCELIFTTCKAFYMADPYGYHMYANIFSCYFVDDVSQRLAETNLTANDDNITIPEMLRVSKGDIYSILVTKICPLVYT